MANLHFADSHRGGVKERWDEDEGRPLQDHRGDQFRAHRGEGREPHALSLSEDPTRGVRRQPARGVPRPRLAFLLRDAQHTVEVVGQGVDELLYLLRRVLQIVVERNHDASARSSPTADERIVLPEVAHELHDAHTRIRRAQLLHARKAAVLAAVVDQDDFEGAHGLQRGAEASVQLRQCPRAVVDGTTMRTETSRHLQRCARCGLRNSRRSAHRSHRAARPTLQITRSMRGRRGSRDRNSNARLADRARRSEDSSSIPQPRPSISSTEYQHAAGLNRLATRRRTASDQNPQVVQDVENRRAQRENA